MLSTIRKYPTLAREADTDLRQHDAGVGFGHKKAPSGFAARGREPQAACTDRPWRRERGPATGTCLHKGRAVCKNEEAPCLLGRGPRESSGDLLSRARRPGTIGDEGLDFRVRKGNGYDPLSVTAETILAATTCCRKSLPEHSLEAGGSGLLTQPIEPNR